MKKRFFKPATAITEAKQ